MLRGLVAGAAAAAVVGSAVPADAMTPHPSLVSELTGQTTGVQQHQGYRINWDRDAAGRVYLKVRGSGLVDSADPAYVNGQRLPGMVHPQWWGCTTMVVGAISAVGGVVLGILALSGEPLDLGFIVIGPETVRLLAAAFSGIGTLESVVSQYVC